MPNNVIRQEQPVPRECDECGQKTVRQTIQEQNFPYGADAGQVMLRANVPVWSCATCGDQYTDHEAEEIRQEVICRHLNRLPPAELRALREAYGLSQDDWARVTGFGSASIKRWETGALIQNEAADRYLRLLADPRVFAKLRSFQQSAIKPVSEHRFRTELPETLRQEARVFELRRSPISQRAA